MKTSKQITLCLTFVFVMINTQILFAEPLVITYPASESELDKRYNYHWEILKAALNETKEEGPFVVRQSELRMTEKRLIRELSASSGKINIIRETSDNEFEELFHPIRIPLLKGALGWRVFLIRKDRQKEFSKIKTLEQLKKLRIGAGQGWGNIALLEANNIPVVTGSNYEGLFKMLMAKRFDLFSRGIMEAPIELAERKEKFPDMAIEEHLILRYTILEYFFVNKKDKAIADRIERGLNKIIGNGIFDKLFDKYYWKSIEGLDLDKRIIFDINNPSAGFFPPVDRKELWLEDFLQKKKSGKL